MIVNKLIHIKYSEQTLVHSECFISIICYCILHNRHFVWWKVNSRWYMVNSQEIFAGKKNEVMLKKM